MKRTHGAHAYVGLLLVVIATATSLFLVPRIEISGLEIDNFSVPDEVEDRNQPWRGSGQSEPWLVSVERAVPPLQSVLLVATLSDLLSSDPEVERVVSITSFDDIDADSDSLGSEPLLHSLTAREITDAEAVMRRHRFLERYLVSSDGERWNIWAYVSGADPEAIYARIEALVRGQTADSLLEVDLLGVTPLDLMWTELVRQQALLLGSISLLAGLAVLSVIARGVRGGLVLWSTVAISATWTLALFPLFGKQLTGEALLVPLEAFAVATSYGLHLRRFYVVQDATNQAVARSVRPLILTAAATTALGFLTLLVVRTESVTHLGAFLAASVGFSVVVVFVISPFGRPFIRHVPAGGATRLTGALRFWWLPLSIASVCAFGMLHTEWGMSLAQALGTRSSAGRAVAAMTEHYGGDEELVIELDSGSEYGLMTEEGFAALEFADRRLKSTDQIDMGVTLIDLTSWLNGRLEGVEQEVMPADAVQFGESLELAYSVGLDRLVDDLITRDYRRARFRVRIDTQEIQLPERNNLMFALRDELNGYADGLSDSIEFRLSGTAYSSYLAHQNIRSDARDMLLVFVPAAFLVLLILTRSVRDSTIILLPSLLAAAAAIGLFGWARVPLSMNGLFVIATLLGVGVDDAILVVRVFSRHRASMSASEAMSRALREAGVAAIQTTVVLCVGLVVLSLSEMAHLRQAGAIMIFGLLLSTAITLSTVPRVLLWLDRGEK